MEYKDNWETLKSFIQEASNMKVGDSGSGVKNAYLSVLKLMNMIENEETDGVHWEPNGCKFVKNVSILSIK